MTTPPAVYRLQCTLHGGIRHDGTVVLCIRCMEAVAWSPWTRDGEEGDGVRQGAGNEIRANRMRSDLEGLLAIQHKQTST